MIHKLGNQIPQIGKDVWVAWNAEVVGDVELGDGVSVWFSAAIRGDLRAIKIGAGTNLQEHVCVHVDDSRDTIIGKRVTIGHGAIIHGCDIGDECLIGMGAIVLSNTTIGKNCVIGAGTVVPEGRTFDDGSLIVGNPARMVRKLTAEEQAQVAKSADHYIGAKDKMMNMEEIKL